MKKKIVQLNKKLIFSKKNIASLSPDEQETLAGGAITGTQNTCVATACPIGTINTCDLECRSLACISKRRITPVCY